jgi:hypothetical protein
VLSTACGAWDPIATIPDLAERGTGLALIARQARDQGVDGRAAELAELAAATLARVPAYRLKADLTGRDPDGITDHLLPDQRALFEAALARTVDPRAVTNPFVRRVLRAERLLEDAAAAARDAGGVDTVHALHAWVREVFAWPAERPAQRLLVNVTAAGLVAVERLVRGSAGPIAVAPLAVPDQLYAAAADLTALRYGLPVHERLLFGLRTLLDAPAPAAAAHLAAMAVGAVGEARGRALAAEVDAALARVTRGAARTRILVTLADSTRPFDAAAADVWLDRATAIADERLLPGERGDVLRLLYPRLVSQRPAEAARALLGQVHESWPQAMALLDAAANDLARLCGADLAVAMISAYERARAFGAPALRPATSR